ncbi:MAG: hypothetical protein ACOC0J_00730 [Myxococcota bacterium]
MDQEDAKLIEELFEHRARAIYEWRRLKSAAEDLRRQASDKWLEAQKVSAPKVADKFGISSKKAKAIAKRVERRVRRSEHA